MRLTLLLLLGSLLLCAGAAQEPDPWDLPEVNGALLVAELVSSEREYTILLCDEVGEEAKLPDRVELELASSDRRTLDRCRKEIEEGKAEKALRTLDNMLRRSAANHDAGLLRARALHVLGRPEEALEALRSSLIGNRRNPEAWALLERLAALRGRTVVRPDFSPRGWVGKAEDGSVLVAYHHGGKEDVPWVYYAAARAVYRHEGRFAREHEDEKEYRFTFREQLLAVAAAVNGAANARARDEKVPDDLAHLLAERDAGTLVPFVFFALYTEPLPARPERDFDALLHRLETYFDERILVKAEKPATER